VSRSYKAKKIHFSLYIVPEIEQSLAVMKAQILPNEIPVLHSYRACIGREFLTVQCPEGWDDVKKIKNKVLLFEGRKFTYTGWNSDRNEAFFTGPINGTNSTATIL
jgi:hypothetical protein